MKTSNILFAALLLLSLEGIAVAGHSPCQRSYMHDRCAADDYSVVETEPFVKGKHNCMAIAHYFPGEEPADYCAHEGGKNTVRPSSPVASVDS
ncbi:hypothetical protein [Nitratifractor sp.]